MGVRKPIGRATLLPKKQDCQVRICIGNSLFSFQSEGSQQISVSPVTATTPIQPSASPATTTTPIQPSASLATTSTLAQLAQPIFSPPENRSKRRPIQPSASPVTATTPIQPSASPATTSTLAQPIFSPPETPSKRRRALEKESTAKIQKLDQE